LQAEFPGLTTIVNNVTRSWSSVATGEEEHILYGPGVIHEQNGDRVYEISADSFFQTNTLQAEKLYELTRLQAGLTGSEVLYDLFCGAGTIAIYLADQIKEGWGFEMVPAAVRNARRNTRMNSVDNMSFIEGDLKETLTAGNRPRPDVVVLDPPRNGVHRDVLAWLAELAPQRIVYVSCNPATLARDCRLLADSGYQPRRVLPVDMFPYTMHTESVALLERSS
ncbi:MAG: 23S rRNA (uracil(1939)-C(5))-methyltransferase RlmD, partial [Candidatus Delongbacteria bacterium]|nr:23S rRNA (uracil(1939)-C(5))-methyltransferase RlmD [Candidatus Delongbacteria bacterium]